MKPFKIIGTVYLNALPGAAQDEHLHPTEVLHRAGLHAVKEVQVLAQCGLNAVILQNYGDLPHFKSHAPADTIASLAVIAAAVRESAKIGIGIQLLEKDPRATLAIAAVTGCDFIRVPVSAGADALSVLARERSRLHSSVDILAEIDHPGLASSYPDYSQDYSWSNGIILSTRKFSSVQTEGKNESPSKKPNLGASLPIFLDMDPSPNGARAQDLQWLLAHRTQLSGVILGRVLRKGQLPTNPLDVKIASTWATELKKTTRPSLKKKGQSSSRKK